MKQFLSIHHPGEDIANGWRDLIFRYEPRSSRANTPTQAVLARSAGIYHWTPDGRRLTDCTSGVLVANLGHNPSEWYDRLAGYMQWPVAGSAPALPSPSFFEALPLTAYNAITQVEANAGRRLVSLLQSRPGGKRLEQVLWAASGSEAVQKALWSALALDPRRNIIVATRHGFHGKKGLAGATSGCETDHERDPRVQFISFPMEECVDVQLRGQLLNLERYENELRSVKKKYGGQLCALITEPYLGAAGSYHPPREYLQLLQSFCRENDLVFILDEIQSNFGRTGNLFAFETYALEPDIVILGKGLANGAPVAAAVGLADVFASLDYGEASDTYSANPFVCAAVLATLDLYLESNNVLDNVRRVSPIIESGLLRLKELPFVKHVRGEKGGMVWGVEMTDFAGRSATELANACVLECYRGENDRGIHLLGPLAKKVLRIAPPLIITEDQASQAMELMHRLLQRLAKDLS